MYRKVFRKNKGKIPFPTQEIRVKSFARELKLLLLSDQKNIGIKKPEYGKQINALNNLMIKVGADFSYKDKGELKTSPDFISKSRLSDWWNGKAIPSPAKQLNIEKSLPNLASKWFDRSSFSNRFQLHLATLDLNYIDSRNSSYAANEAWSILDKITSDWRPKGYSNNELEISGPWERAGYHSNCLIKEDSIQKKIKYDLTLGPVSHVDTEVPQAIAEIYQQGNPFSIISYMFCLLCLDEERNNSGHKNDLFLDFLSALNCAHFFIYKKYRGMPPHGRDKAATNITKLFLHISEYYYDDYWSPKNEQKRHFKHQAGLEKAKTEGLTSYSTFNTDLFNHPSVFLSDTLKGIIADTPQYSTLQPDEKSELRALIKKSTILLSNFRKFYIDLYKISGLTEEEVVQSLLSRFWRYSSEDGSDIKVHGPSNKSYASPYGWKVPPQT